MMSSTSVKRSAPWLSLARRASRRAKWCFHWPERKILIVGDAVVGDPPGRCKLLPEKVVDDPARLRESVRSLLALDFDILLPGDGEPILKTLKSGSENWLEHSPTHNLPLHLTGQCSRRKAGGDPMERL